MNNDTASHEFDETGHDLWGYNVLGHYNPIRDRAPFQRTPFPHCEPCDAGMCQVAASGTLELEWTA